jgi:hypothetical protein
MGINEGEEVEGGTETSMEVPLGILLFNYSNGCFDLPME